MGYLFHRTVPLLFNNFPEVGEGATLPIFLYLNVPAGLRKSQFAKKFTKHHFGPFNTPFSAEKHPIWPNWVLWGQIPQNASHFWKLGPLGQWRKPTHRYTKINFMKIHPKWQAHTCTVPVLYTEYPPPRNNLCQPCGLWLYHYDILREVTFKIWLY